MQREVALNAHLRSAGQNSARYRSYPIIVNE